MSIDKNTARWVADLALIAVKESDLTDLASELTVIVNFMQKLSEVDIKGVPTKVSVTPMPLPLRNDVVAGGDQIGDVLANAPDVREGFFCVPKVVE